MLEWFENWLETQLRLWGIADLYVLELRVLILLSMMGLVAWLSHWFARKIAIGWLYRFFLRTSFSWDDIFVEKRAFDKFAHLVPAIVVKVTATAIFRGFESWLPLVMKLTDAYLVLAGTLAVVALLKAIETVISQSKAFVDKPVASYFQLLRILIYITSAILVLSVLMGKSPGYFLGAFGALTAIILLIFKDTILGLVASVQIASNDMVRVGDWVEMPKFNADGDVIAINLNTVKIMNWDKTITTVPTFYFITDSFKNWRGMQEQGGRRIKRSLYIDVHSIRFVDPETRERFKRFYLISDFVGLRQKEIEAYNAERQLDTSELINGRRMTNVGVFRRYAETYIKCHPRIRQDMTILVRQMAMEDRGLPIEIYCFTATTAWLEYEEIQADIFDHLMAAVPQFGLEIFQQPGHNSIRDAVKLLRDKY
ncbi:MAG: mechanosensitive ion channel family protein [Bacteroidia bacterium]